MYILGILPFGYDPSACLLKDEKLIAMVDEERFIRVKHAFNCFPINAIKFCLNYGKISLQDVDYISIGWGCSKYPEEMAIHYLKGWHKYQNIKDLNTLEWEINCLRRFNPKNMKERVESQLKQNGFNVSIPEIKFINHHLSHAASTFYCSGFKKASILTIDGSGEENTTVLWHGDNKKITQIECFNIPHSLGWFYASFTQFLGFKPYDGEGKVMGLAPYGKVNKNVSNIIDRIVISKSNGNYEIDPSYIYYGSHNHGERYTDKLVEEIGVLPRVEDGEITEAYKDIAYTAQAKLEEIAIDITKKLVEQTSIGNLCVAGGVGLNCKMNGKLKDLDCVNNIFIQPVSGDNGSSLGSALVLSESLDSRIKFEQMKHAYWGPEFTNEEIEVVLKKNGLKYEYYDDISGVCGELLSKGKIIGWFQGRMEIGPRALGNRSILADPRDAKMKDIVNLKVKHRENWRPFAPSLLAEAADEYLVNPCESPFMILSFEVNPEKMKEIPAVIHVDDSTRPHTVEKSVNPIYWKLIKSFEEQTGVPVILNTSFNMRGEPIVCTPRDAINDFLKSEMDILVLGNYLIKKK